MICLPIHGRSLLTRTRWSIERGCGAREKGRLEKENYGTGTEGSNAMATSQVNGNI